MKSNFILKGLILLAMLVAQTACQKKRNQIDIVRQNAETYIKPKLNDASSYEFVEITLLDSTSYRDNIKYRIDSFGEEIQSDKAELKRQEGYRRSFPTLYDKNEVRELQGKITQNNKIIKEIKAIENQMGTHVNDIAAYKYLFKLRGTNAFAAKMLNEYILQTGPAPDYKVLNMTTDPDKVYLNPNEFPGYEPMIKKYIK
ncbi:hypothetical protein [Spirosoma aerophilum]